MGFDFLYTQIQSKWNWSVQCHLLKKCLLVAFGFAFKGRTRLAVDYKATQKGSCPVLQASFQMPISVLNVDAWARGGGGDDGVDKVTVGS